MDFKGLVMESSATVWLWGWGGGLEMDSGFMGRLDTESSATVLL